MGMVLINKKTGEDYGVFGTPYPDLDLALSYVFFGWMLDEDGEILVEGEHTGIYYDDLELVFQESTVKEIRKKTGLTQEAFSKKYGIPKRTIENWEGGKSNPPDYVLKMLARIVDMDTENAEE